MDGRPLFFRKMKCNKKTTDDSVTRFPPKKNVTLKKNDMSSCWGGNLLTYFNEKNSYFPLYWLVNRDPYNRLSEKKKIYIYITV